MGDSAKICTRKNFRYTVFKYSFQSSWPLKLQTKILFLIFPALVRELFGQRSPLRAAIDGQFYILSVPHCTTATQADSSYVPAIFQGPIDHF